MIAIRVFKCDLCNSQIIDTNAGGIGIRFESMNRIKNVPMWDSEHHICQPCLKGLEDMFTELRKLESIRAAVDAEDRAL